MNTGNLSNTINLRNMTSLYIIHKDKMLLLYRQGSRVVNNVWIGSAGGHFEKDELNDPFKCVLRELKEELSINEDMLSGLCLKYIAIRYTKGEVRQNYYFFAHLNAECSLLFNSNEGISKWFKLSELCELNMPYTSKYVIEHYLEIGKYDNEVYCGTADGEKIVFTKLPEF